MPRLTDTDAIRAILHRDPGWCVYALGDLSPAWFRKTEWFTPDLTLVLKDYGTEHPVRDRRRQRARGARRRHVAGPPAGAERRARGHRTPRPNRRHARDVAHDLDGRARDPGRRSRDPSWRGRRGGPGASCTPMANGPANRPISSIRRWWLRRCRSSVSTRARSGGGGGHALWCRATKAWRRWATSTLGAIAEDADLGRSVTARCLSELAGHRDGRTQRPRR